MVGSSFLIGKTFSKMGGQNHLFFFFVSPEIKEPKLHSLNIKCDDPINALCIHLTK